MPRPFHTWVECALNVIVLRVMADLADVRANERLQIYLKLIDYKRGIGTTQWTVLSVFTTASGAVILFALGRQNSIVVGLSLLLGVVLYWLGFLLYCRYRSYNLRVSEYLIELEEEMGFRFQKHVGSFHHKGLSTQRILLLGGIIYLLFAGGVFVMSISNAIPPRH